MSRDMRHSVTAWRPPTDATLDDRGQLTGNDVIVQQSIPCRIETLQTNELIAARQQYASASHRVTMYRSSNHPLDEKCYLKWGSRRLDIGGIIDPDNDERSLVMICGEVKT